MQPPRPGSPPLDPRLVALLVLTLGVVGMGINEWMASDSHEVYLIAVIACPTMALFGLGGLVDPRVLWSMGPHRRGYPASVRGAGIFLLLLGVAGSAWLSLVRYSLVPLDR